MFNDETCFAKVAEFLMTVHFVIKQAFGNITSMVIIQLQVYFGHKLIWVPNAYCF